MQLTAESVRAIYGEGANLEVKKDERKDKQAYSRDYRIKMAELSFRIGVNKVAEREGINTGTLYSWYRKRQLGHL